MDQPKKNTYCDKKMKKLDKNGFVGKMESIFSRIKEA
jgi:hypothetical protein